MTDWTYIPIDEDLRLRPQFVRFQLAAGVNEHEAVGLLFSMWAWVKRVFPDGHVRATADEAAAALRVAPKVVEAMIEADFVRVDDNADWLVVAGWEDGAGKATVKRRASAEKKREQAAERKRRQRERERKQNEADDATPCTHCGETLASCVEREDVFGRHCCPTCDHPDLAPSRSVTRDNEESHAPVTPQKLVSRDTETETDTESETEKDPSSEFPEQNTHPRLEPSVPPEGPPSQASESVPSPSGKPLAAPVFESIPPPEQPSPSPSPKKPDPFEGSTFGAVLDGIFDGQPKTTRAESKALRQLLAEGYGHSFPGKRWRPESAETRKALRKVLREHKPSDVAKAIVGMSRDPWPERRDRSAAKYLAREENFDNFRRWYDDPPEKKPAKRKHDPRPEWQRPPDTDRHGNPIPPEESWDDKDQHMHAGNYVWRGGEGNKRWASPPRRTT